MLLAAPAAAVAAVRRNRALERDCARMIQVAEESTYHGPYTFIDNLPTDSEEWICSGRCMCYPAPDEDMEPVGLKRVEPFSIDFTYSDD